MDSKKLFGFLIPVLFFVIVITFVHFDKAFEYDFDEGVYLMRAYLHAEGYALYKDIWMDQPPLLTLMLSCLIRVFGPSVYIARLLILAFSSLLLWALYQIIVKTLNALSAAWAVVLVILSCFYVKLSVSAMAPIPSVALALLSIYGVFLYQESYKKRYLLFSGGLFALALLMKFFVIIFLPAVIYGIAVIEKRRPVKEGRLTRLCCTYFWWLAAFSAVFLYIVFVAAPVDFSQLVEPYILARRAHFPAYNGIFYWFIVEYNVVLLAITALIFLRRDERRFILVPFISLLCGALILCSHNPIWYYYRFYITIPMYWLASFGVYTLYKRIKEEWKNKDKQLGARTAVAIFFLFLTVVLSAGSIPLKYKQIRFQLIETLAPGSPYIVSIMRQYSKYTHLVVTDRPIYAFYADMPAYPYLATASLKRMTVGLITASDYIDIIRKEQPELVVFARFPELRDKVIPHIQDDYELRYRSPNGSERLYILKRIKEGILQERRAL